MSKEFGRWWGGTSWIRFATCFPEDTTTFGRGVNRKMKEKIVCANWIHKATAVQTTPKQDLRSHNYRSEGKDVSSPCGARIGSANLGGKKVGQGKRSPRPVLSAHATKPTQQPPNTPPKKQTPPKSNPKQKKIKKPKLYQTKIVGAPKVSDVVEKKTGFSLVSTTLSWAEGEVHQNNKTQGGENHQPFTRRATGNKPAKGSECQKRKKAPRYVWQETGQCAKGPADQTGRSS